MFKTLINNNNLNLCDTIVHVAKKMNTVLINEENTKYKHNLFLGYNVANKHVRYFK